MYYLLTVFENKNGEDVTLDVLYSGRDWERARSVVDAVRENKELIGKRIRFITSKDDGEVVRNQETSAY